MLARTRTRRKTSRRRTRGENEEEVDEADGHPRAFVRLGQVDVDNCDCCFVEELLRGGLRPWVVHAEVNSLVPPPIGALRPTGRAGRSGSVNTRKIRRRHDEGEEARGEGDEKEEARKERGIWQRKGGG